MALRQLTQEGRLKWVKNATCDWVAEYTVPWVASASPHGRAMALKWMESKDETIASAGWQTYSSRVAIKEDADRARCHRRHSLRAGGPAGQEVPPDFTISMGSDPAHTDGGGIPERT